MAREFTYKRLCGLQHVYETGGRKNVQSSGTTGTIHCWLVFVATLLLLRTGKTISTWRSSRTTHGSRSSYILFFFAGSFFSRGRKAQTLGEEKKIHTAKKQTGKIENRKTKKMYKRGNQIYKKTAREYYTCMWRQV